MADFRGLGRFSPALVRSVAALKNGGNPGVWYRAGGKNDKIKIIYKKFIKTI